MLPQTLTQTQTLTLALTLTKPKPKPWPKPIGITPHLQERDCSWFVRCDRRRPVADFLSGPVRNLPCVISQGERVARSRCA